MILERWSPGHGRDGPPRGRVAPSAAADHSPVAAVQRRLVRVGRRLVRMPEEVADLDRDAAKEAIGQHGVMHSIALIATYFGQLPAWIDNYIETCKHNPSITWFLFVDGAFPRNRSANVRLVHFTLEDLSRLILDRLGVAANITYGYKACDIKPMFGELFADYLRGFDFWGHCDLDIMWGALRTFLTPQRLADFDIISTCPAGLCGPLTIFRNVPFINRLYRRGPYEQALSQREFQGFDERGLSPVVARAHEAGELRLLCTAVHEYDGYHPEAGSGESACTWRNGRVICTPEGRELMYYHFAGTKRWSWPDIWDESRNDA